MWLNCKKNENFYGKIKDEIVALPCNVHCFLPDLPDNGTIPAIAPKIGKIATMILLLLLLVYRNIKLFTIKNLYYIITLKIS